MLRYFPQCFSKCENNVFEEGSKQCSVEECALKGRAKSLLLHLSSHWQLCQCICQREDFCKDSGWFNRSKIFPHLTHFSSLKYRNFSLFQSHCSVCMKIQVLVKVTMKCKWSVFCNSSVAPCLHCTWLLNTVLKTLSWQLCCVVVRVAQAISSCSSAPSGSHPRTFSQLRRSRISYRINVKY